jgi:hypothetical protein
MARTTVDIDDPVLRDLKKLQKESGQSLGKLISELLAKALAARRTVTKRRPFRWRARSMGKPKVDLRDKEALVALLDGEIDDRIR